MEASRTGWASGPFVLLGSMSATIGACKKVGKLVSKEGTELDYYLAELLADGLGGTRDAWWVCSTVAQLVANADEKKAD